jgi:uncharacterized membrane protein required for colicin V production
MLFLIDFFFRVLVAKVCEKIGRLIRFDLLDFIDRLIGWFISVDLI